ncbi:uncharacterized protein LOC127283954 isoform X2 [Leptopilina boulardi]|uniref:uncharacterized protein LOC127283954 isoform X2 n=1 Tax=Leptopilina boulardi TaxID=63433 RepID=UPI0021F60334|nr:uncharacterized protein LOC127283954 isoform X2 [Leptopilina boulardi]
MSNNSISSNSSDAKDSQTRNNESLQIFQKDNLPNSVTNSDESIKGNDSTKREVLLKHSSGKIEDQKRPEATVDCTKNNFLSTKEIEDFKLSKLKILLNKSSSILAKNFQRSSKTSESTSSQHCKISLIEKSQVDIFSDNRENFQNANLLNTNGELSKKILSSKGKISQNTMELENLHPSSKKYKKISSNTKTEISDFEFLTIKPYRAINSEDESKSISQETIVIIERGDNSSEKSEESSQSSIFIKTFQLKNNSEWKNNVDYRRKFIEIGKWKFPYEIDNNKNNRQMELYRGLMRTIICKITMCFLFGIIFPLIIIGTGFLYRNLLNKAEASFDSSKSMESLEIFQHT